MKGAGGGGSCWKWLVTLACETGRAEHGGLRGRLSLPSEGTASQAKDGVLNGSLDLSTLR